MVLDCETMPFVDVTATRMLNQLAAEIGQVREMIAAVSDHGGTPENHRTVHEAAGAARAGPSSQPAKDG